MFVSFVPNNRGLSEKYFFSKINIVQLNVSTLSIKRNKKIPHSDNADVEYYTTYPKTIEKTGETRLRMRAPKGTPSVTCTYYSKKEKKRGGKSAHAHAITSVMSGLVTSLPVAHAHTITSGSATTSNTTMSVSINRNYSAILATLQITSYALGV